MTTLAELARQRQVNFHTAAIIAGELAKRQNRPSAAFWLGYFNTGLRDAASRCSQSEAARHQWSYLSHYLLTQAGNLFAEDAPAYPEHALGMEHAAARTPNEEFLAVICKEFGGAKQ